MLRKLLKYEFKATGRTLFPLYIALVVLAAISRIILGTPDNNIETPGAISIMSYMCLLVGTVVTTFIVMLQRFHKNLLGDEGYLMFTLPTVPWKLITSKLLVSLVWSFVGAFMALSSILILAADNVTITALSDILTQIVRFITQEMDVSGALHIVEFVLMVLIMPISGILLIYASIAIGHQVSKHKLLIALGAFVGLSTVSMALLAMFTDFLMVRISVPATVHTALWIFIGFHTLMAAIYFFITNTLLSKRLNLE
jgi:hypothetical protein